MPVSSARPTPYIFLINNAHGAEEKQMNPANINEDFSGQVVRVTGAASGIGREAARAFANRGALV